MVQDIYLCIKYGQRFEIVKTIFPINDIDRDFFFSKSHCEILFNIDLSAWSLSQSHTNEQCFVTLKEDKNIARYSSYIRRA